MEHVNLVKTSDMPAPVFNFLIRYTYLGQRDFDFWIVGGYVYEAKESPNDYDNEHVKAARLVDEWLISQGAKVGERIIIEHV